MTLQKPTLSVVIPSLNVAKTLRQTVASLQAGYQYFDMEIILSDCGSTDDTLKLGQELGLKIVSGIRGRGTQIKTGVAAGIGNWLIFLHADTQLDAGWASEVAKFIETKQARKMGAYFRFNLDDDHPKALRMAKVVAWRARVFGLPYGDQGFFINRDYLAELGGVSAIPLMEDVDLVRRIGRKNLYAFNSKAVTSAVRYLQGGYNRRAAFHLFCLFLYMIGVPVKYIVRIYG